MRLFLHTGYESKWAQQRWRHFSTQWQAAGHLDLCDSADQADAVLITMADPQWPYTETVQDIATSSLYRRTPNKCFVFDTQPNPLGLYPGLYCSLKRSFFSATRHRTSCYLQSFNEFVRADDAARPMPIRYLFSFQGNLTSRTRSRLFETDFRRDDVLIERTGSLWEDTGGERFRHFKEQYADNLLRSKFILCPRGISVSSFRLFEAMQSGRVPVIMSDSWVPPRSIDWDACSLRVSDRDIHRLVEICLTHEARWASMAEAARATWEKWFSPAGLGRLIRSSLQDIEKSRRFSEELHRAEWPLRRAAVGVRRALIRTASHLQNMKK